MKTYLVLALLTMTSAMVACTDPEEGFYVGRHRVYNNGNAAGGPLFYNVSLNCEKASDCSPTAGLIVVSQGTYSASQCSGFLTDQDVFVTNDHCLNRKLTIGSSCGNDVEVFFASAQGYAAERVPCERVLWRSGDGEQEGNIYVTDVAYIKLARPVSRPTFKFSHGGFDQFEPVSIFKVNPVRLSYGIGGLLQTRRCKVSHQSIFGITSDSRLALDFMVVDAAADSDCRIISGNSGSAVVRGDDEVRGIIHHGPKAEKIKKRIEFVEFDINANFGIGTNFGCIRGPNENAFVAPFECAQATDPNLLQKSSQKAISKFFNQAAVEADKAAVKWGEARYPMFKWHMGVAEQSGERYLIPVPECSLPRGLELYKTRLNNYKNEAALTALRWPLFTAKVTDMSSSVVIRPASELLSVTLAFNPEAMANGKSANVKLRSDIGTRPTFFDAEVQACK